MYIYVIYIYTYIYIYIYRLVKEKTFFQNISATAIYIYIYIYIYIVYRLCILVSCSYSYFQSKITISQAVKLQFHRTRVGGIHTFTMKLIKRCVNVRLNRMCRITIFCAFYFHLANNGQLGEVLKLTQNSYLV